MSLLLSLDFPHMQEPDHNGSRDRAKEVTACVSELHLAASLHCAVSWNRKSPITAQPALFSLGHRTKTIAY